jgi:hypothetical protein
MDGTRQDTIARQMHLDLHAPAARASMPSLPGTAPESQAEVVAAHALLSLVPTDDEPSVDAGAMFTPGAIVWAKVEGHEWWPAQVVRRRAVPRGDVDPPPGGPSNVMNCFPVVFLTKRGVPGEIRESLESDQSAVAASVRAHKAAAGADDAEAEYAWVTASSLCRFEIDKPPLTAEQVAANPDLAACVKAAQKATVSQPISASDSLKYDSDGGWGFAQRQPADPSSATGNRRSRGARARGGRRQRNRRGGHVADDEPNASYTFQPPQISVDAILGWRYPLSKADTAHTQRGERAVHAAKLLQLQKMHESGSGDAYAAEVQAHAPSSEAAEAGLLLDFHNSASAQWEESGAHREESGGRREREFLIKWSDFSHIKNEWVSESRVMALAKRKLLNFTKKYGAHPVDMSNEHWSVPERFVARRKCPYGPGWEILVKWKGERTGCSCLQSCHLHAASALFEPTACTQTRSNHCILQRR